MDVHISDIDEVPDCHMDCDSQGTEGCEEDIAQHDKGMLKVIIYVIHIFLGSIN